MSFSRDDFLGYTSVEVKAVDVADLGAGYVRVMSGKERDAFEASLVSDDSDPITQQIRARLVVACLCDKDGKTLLTPDDLDAVNEKPSNILQEIADAAMAINKLRSGGDEEAEKN